MRSRSPLLSKNLLTIYKRVDYWLKNVMDDREDSKLSLCDTIPKIAGKKHYCLAISKFITTVENLELNIRSLETRTNNLEQKVRDFLQEKSH